MWESQSRQTGGAPSRTIVLHRIILRLLSVNCGSVGRVQGSLSHTTPRAATPRPSHLIPSHPIPSQHTTPHHNLSILLQTRSRLVRDTRRRLLGSSLHASCLTLVRTHVRASPIAKPSSSWAEALCIRHIVSSVFNERSTDSQVLVCTSQHISSRSTYPYHRRHCSAIAYLVHVNRRVLPARQSLRSSIRF